MMTDEVLKVVVWLYSSPTGHRNYTNKHVELFKRQFSAHYHSPHEFIILSEPEFPNNFRRLWIYSKSAEELLGGGRVFMSDLDVIILGRLEKYLDRPEPFVIMTDPTQKGPNYRYSPSCLLTLGARTDIWESFIRAGSLQAMEDYYINDCKQKRVVGSDMAWLSYYLKDEKVPTFNQYRARNLPKDPAKFPRDCLIVHFSGDKKPWDKIRRGSL